MCKVILVNGPCNSFSGVHESGINEFASLNEVEKQVSISLSRRNIGYEFFHSNSEEEIIFWLKKQSLADFLLLNPGTLTHTSLGLRDAVLNMKVPFLEIHPTIFFKIEEFEYFSRFSEIAIGTLVGLGLKGFLIASQFAADFLEQKQSETNMDSSMS